MLSDKKKGIENAFKVSVASKKNALLKLGSLHMMSLTLGKYCLKWDEYQKNISCSLVDFREKDKLVDVTLMCEDNKHINAHRVILSTGSQLFKKKKHFK